MPATRRLANPSESVLVLSMANAIGNQVFSGQPPQIIGACLAELMGTFLLNHKIPDDLVRQNELREEILTQWCDTVRQLVAVQDPPATETMQ